MWISQTLTFGKVDRFDFIRLKLFNPHPQLPCFIVSVACFKICCESGT